MYFSYSRHDSIDHAKTENAAILHAFNCDACDAKFVTRLHLSNHKKTHGTKYNCRKCSHAYTNVDSLRRHNCVTTVTLLECWLCNEQFSDLAGLNQHQTKHTDLKVERTGLKRKHIDIEEPVFCSYCGELVTNLR